MTDWRALAGVIEWRLDYAAATNQPPDVGEVLSRSAFLVVKPETEPPSPRRSYLWRIAEMGLIGSEHRPHRPGSLVVIKTDATDIASYLWPQSGRNTEDAQVIHLDQFGATVANPSRTGESAHHIRDMLDPIWYEPVWGAHASGEAISVDAFSKELIEEEIRARCPGPDPFFSSPKVEAVRVVFNSELGVVEEVTSFIGDEEVGWLRLSSIHQLL